jgi:hypothetical protein
MPCVVDQRVRRSLLSSCVMMAECKRIGVDEDLLLLKVLIGLMERSHDAQMAVGGRPRKTEDPSDPAQSRFA